jgi:quercetin dioxygenase-like cupin family protein
MGYTTAAAGDKLQRHFHTNTSVVQYVVKGRTLMSFGPDHEKKEVIVEPGDFIFIPRGEIHGASCLEDGAVVFCYTEVASKEEAGTIFIEPPHKK